jgi:endonuclease VIII
MPEGHTIHRLAREQTRDLAGQNVCVSSPQGRFLSEAAALDDQLLERVEARGKHLFYHWRDAPLLHVHLGLIGSFRRFPAPAPPPRATVQLRLASPLAAYDLVGATTRELIDQARYTRILERLGPDLLASDGDAQRAWDRLRKRSTPIGTALLDQSVLAGVGNVFRAEALFVNGIHPLRPANSLTRDEFDALWTTLGSMLRQGVEDQRIVTVHPSERAEQDVERVTPEEAFYVYKQSHCHRCGSPIHTWPLGPRRAYACERCQPPPAAA